MRPLLVGLGNEDRRDDGVGLLLARRLKPGLGPNWQVLLLGGDPLRLIEVFDGHSPVWILDAMQAGLPPGSLRRFDPASEPLPLTAFPRSTHLLGLAGVLELARALGRLPEVVRVVGLQGVEFGFGRGCSPQVAEALAGWEREVLALLDRAGAGESLAIPRRAPASPDAARGPPRKHAEDP